MRLPRCIAPVHPALSPRSLVMLAALGWVFCGAATAVASDRYDRVVAQDGQFLRQRRAFRESTRRQPEQAARWCSLVDSLSVQIHRGRPQVVTDFLDGSTRVEIPAAAHLDYQAAFGYSLWIRLSSSSMLSQTKIVSQAGVSTGKITVMGAGRRILLMLRFQDDSTVTFRTQTEIPLAKWVHLCVTYSRADGAAIYLDGERAPLRIVSGTPTDLPLRSLPEQPLYLGGLDRAFPGCIDDFRVYGRGLGTSDARRLAEGEDLRDALLGHWPLDEREGLIARDVSAYACDGSIGERVLVNLPGRIGACMGFDRDRESWVRGTRALENRLADLQAVASQAGLSSPPVDVPAILRMLAERGAILVHFARDERSPQQFEVWILDPDASVTVGPVPLPLGQSWYASRDHLLEELHGGELTTSGEETYRQWAREVARGVWDPIEDAVAARREIWLRLTPELRGVPFGALVDRHGRYLIETHAFARCGPVAALAERQGRPLRPLSDLRAVVLANPDFHALGDGNAGRLPLAPLLASRARALDDERRSCTVEGPPLLGTDREVRALLPLLDHAGLPSVEVFDWDDAQETVLDRLTPDVGVLHVATHGYQVEPSCLPVVPKDPLYLSGVVLAGAMRIVPDGYRGAGEGLLSAAEVAEMDLCQTELLVFSGCGTAAGMALSNEPLGGLTAAGWLAGARLSVATLWQVSDETMPAQIEAFYAAWTQGVGCASAVRAALLHGMTTTREDRGHAHPRAWAALVAEGL